jgi:hypothetical protein
LQAWRMQWVQTTSKQQASGAAAAGDAASERSSWGRAERLLLSARM